MVALDGDSVAMDDRGEAALPHFHGANFWNTRTMMFSVSRFRDWTPTVRCYLGVAERCDVYLNY